MGRGEALWYSRGQVRISRTDDMSIEHEPQTATQYDPQRAATGDTGGETDPAIWRHWLRAQLPWLIIGLLALAIGVALFWNRVFIVIHAGEAGVLWHRFGGTRIDRVYSEGLHIISPLDQMFHYEVRKQVTLHELDVLSAEGLSLHLELAIRFLPEYELLGMLHERIGPDYLTRVVVPQTESVLRKALGRVTAVQIYTNEDGLLTRALLKAMEEVGRNFVVVEDVIIRRIRLPDKVQEAIEDKLTQQQLYASYAFRRQTAILEANRKRIEGAGIRDYQAIVAETLTDRLLEHQGIVATRMVAESANEKTVVVGVGAGEIGLPIILGDFDRPLPGPPQGRELP